MLQLDISPEIEAFREEFRVWLAAHPVPRAAKDSSLEAFIEVGRDWQRLLASGRWLGTHWPEEFGGRGRSLVEEAIVQEELARAGSPQILGLFGLTMVGPVLIKHGTQAQKSRFLAKILAAEEIWCQGFSEPSAGSDLANIKTKAHAVEGGFLVSGQKVWTSFAHIADWCFLLCRTTESLKKHEGLTYLLVDMKTKGITTRPLRQMSGESEFNEVFFDEVFVPHENVVGEVGEGWKIAISTLMFERVVLTFARQLQSESALRGLIAAHKNSKNPAVIMALGKELARACAIKALAYQHLIEYADGKSPGPEGSMDKLLWSESFQSICELALELRGPEAALGENDAQAGSDILRYLYSRGRTIAAGTSEIQRNIIAERVLGLPRAR